MNEKMSISDLESELHSLKNELMKKDLALEVEKRKREEAEEVLGFYADKKSWERFTEAYREWQFTEFYAEADMVCADDCIIEDDTEIFKEAGFTSKGYQVGGKRARKYFSKQEKSNG